MRYGAMQILQKLLGTDHVRRNFGVYPDDTFVISYPRSGSTWMRFLVANLMFPDEKVTFANLDRLIPATAVASGRLMKNTKRPRVIKSHNYYDHRYRKVLYVVRDPRDVVLSEYRFHLKNRYIEDGYPMDQFVSRFLAGDLGAYGSWRENVGSWLGTRGGTPNFLLLRYEDLVADTERELLKAAVFLGIGEDRERVARAVERSSADNMRAMEKKESENWVVTKGLRKDIPFVGGATSGGWKDKLQPANVAQIESAWGPLMQWLGYELVTGAASPVGSDSMLAAIPAAR